MRPTTKDAPGAMPSLIEPQLATLVNRAPSDGEWSYEIKFDGYRMLSRVENGAAQLITRNGHDWTDRMPKVRDASADGPGPDVMATPALDGNKVLSSDGKDIGEIKDIMLDVRSGRIAYAVLSSGGFLGIGDKLLAIPWRTLRLDTQQKCFVLAMTAERVKNAPGFDKDHWPSMADQTCATSVHHHYGSDPDWGRDPFDRRDDLSVGEIPARSSDTPEAGGLKLSGRCWGLQDSFRFGPCLS